MVNQHPKCPKCGHKLEVPGEKFNSTMACPDCGHEFNPMAELLKQGGEWFENKVHEETSAVSHSQFIAGIKNGSMKVTPFKGNPNALVKGIGRRKTMAVMVLFYVLSPLVLVPLWSWHQKNAWLLFGILACWLTIYLTRALGIERRQYTLGGWMFFAALGSWFFLGIHSLSTALLFCGSYSFFTYMLADGMQNELLKESLLEDGAHFYWAVSERRIWIVTRPFS